VLATVIVAPDNVTGVGTGNWQEVKDIPGSTVAAGLTVIVLVPTAGEHGPEVPSGSFVVRFNIISPLNPAAGVNVTEEGFTTCPVLLRIPDPEVIDHAAVVAPEMLAPESVIGKGDEL
jgi:hypothetical protein